MTNKYFKTLLSLACASNLMLGCLNSENRAGTPAPTTTDTSQESNSLIEINAKSASETVDLVKAQLPESMRSILENSTSKSYLENFIHYASVRNNPKHRIEGLDIYQRVHVTRDRNETSFLDVDVLFDKEQKAENFNGIGNKGLYAQLKKEDLNKNSKELEVDSVCSSETCSKGLIVIKQKVYEKDPVAISQGARQILFYDTKDASIYELIVEGKNLKLSKINSLHAAYSLREKSLENEIRTNEIKLKEATGYKIYCGYDLSKNNRECNEVLVQLLNDTNLEKLKGYDITDLQISNYGSKRNHYHLDVNSNFVAMDVSQSVEEMATFLNRNVDKSDSDAAALRKIKVNKFRELTDEIEKKSSRVIRVIPFADDIDFILETTIKLSVAMEQLSQSTNFSDMRQQKFELALFLDAKGFDLRKSGSSISGINDYWLTINGNASSNEMHKFISKSITKVTKK